MDNKNVFIAIALSMSVLLFWGAFFETPRQINENQSQNKNEIIKKNEQSEITPNILPEKIITEISRKDALTKVDRIIVENEKVTGSISLQGAIFDDLSFKNYKTTLDSEENVVFLNPKETQDGYYIESGWTSVGNKIAVPNLDTIWKVKGNRVLSNNSDVTLEWDNGRGLTFTKTISLDEKYLFKIKQKVKNNTSSEVSLYPYAQITRNKKPDDVMGFYILHEGFIGVFDGELKEDDYDDVKDKKIVRNSDNGWLGITDKYWVTAIVPPEDQNFKSSFLYKDNFRANYILNSPVSISSKTSSENEVRLFVAAKEVETVDGYAESENIDKFDLTIDWGWFYFFTKPLFFVIDYLFKFSGNFGIAIVLITLAIRIIFFPLANYSFRSMAKMKAVQPEMVRLKELHKDDKVKLQQEMMALYRKEKINPASGCLPILIQIPFFFAIYKMLFISLEMRHQPFFGWIQDLSAKDPTTIFNLFGLIPWDPPGFLIIGIWPILMGLTMYLQQKLNPAPADPIQAKIFAFFPLFLTVILAPFPSGLVVYWTVNNILTIAQQWVIMRQTKVKTN
ncbi:MAG: membrane protein insertase YidC [Pseudomonadota bacterium]|nr:membrane protein insertase YidC [Pseudomonadota bacterium]